MHDIRHLSMSELEAGFEAIRESPHSAGTVRMIVRRPAHDEREVLALGELDETAGLVGDSWSKRRSSQTDSGDPHPEAQLTLMNARAVGLLAGTEDRWPLAGDQLYVDFDLSVEHLPAGTRLNVGDATIEITPLPHNGCKLFAQRYGKDAVQFVNSPLGKQFRLRGVYARVVRGGAVRVGDRIIKQ